MNATDYKAKRIALGYTQAGLADALGVSRETIARREAGWPRNPISQEAALALAALPKAKNLHAVRPENAAQRASALKKFRENRK
jgi:DNA-binding XRE family transcriptional regulator